MYEILVGSTAMGRVMPFDVCLCVYVLVVLSFTYDTPPTSLRGEKHGPEVV